MIAPTIGRVVHYRLTREDVRSINRRYVDASEYYGEHRKNRLGTQLHVGNQHHHDEIVPLIVVRVWLDEYSPDNRVCRDYLVGDEDPVFHHPLSSYGINGQAVLDGNDSLWITSAPQGDFPGAWDFPVRI